MDSIRSRWGWIALAALVAGGCAAPGAVIHGNIHLPQGAGMARPAPAAPRHPSSSKSTVAATHGRTKSANSRSSPKSRSSVNLKTVAAKFEPPRPAVAGSGGESVGDVVLFLDRMPAPRPKPRSRAAAPPGHPPARVTIDAAGFTPRVQAVTRGDTVWFVNKDQRFHNAFSVSPVRKFDLGMLAPGAARRVMFDRTGAVRVFCNLHADSSSYVYVVPNAQWTRPDGRGAFELPPLPPGSYQLRAWHPRFGERRWTVQLPRTGIALDLGF